MSLLTSKGGVADIKAYMLNKRGKSEETVNLQSLVIAAFCLPSGLGMFIFPRKKRLAAEAKVRLRKQELAAGAPERYFEEGRSIEAYPLPATDAKWRIRGAFLTMCGIALLFLGYLR
ncbi:MAG: hypothetical protein P4L81_04635 [Candidatus Pacebacteria bacterium]|nr:hypothetical protein [Candidatus Paceibacterota bacterium]